MSTISVVEQAMNHSIAHLGGIDAAMQACDNMYSADFRSEAQSLGDYENWEEEQLNLYTEAARAVYVKETAACIPVRPDTDCDHDLDGYYASLDILDDFACEYMREKYPEFEINAQTQVVMICNYKGEGEDIALYDMAKHLPVFFSKQHSFHQANPNL